MPRALRLGTRRSALARAQSALVAKRLMQLHPGLGVELIGIDTRGDQILDKPLSQVDGKEFFTAEIDAALLDGQVDLTVHSYKDLSLTRPAGIYLAAVPPREQPRDIALFAPDVLERLAAGAALHVGSSSPRRAAFVPDFLQHALPRLADGAPRVLMRDLRGNVDTRLRRLLEPVHSERRLDGIVLALAGLARLWRDESGRDLLRAILPDLRRMVLPLTLCPAAPAQGALAVECRASDAPTRELLRVLDDAATRAAIAQERGLLAVRGGGCHQRFGATRIDVPGLGGLLYERDADEGGVPRAPQLQWWPAQPLPIPPARIAVWGRYVCTTHAIGPDCGGGATLPRTLRCRPPPCSWRIGAHCRCCRPLRSMPVRTFGCRAPTAGSRWRSGGSGSKAVPTALASVSCRPCSLKACCNCRCPQIGPC
jgi:hydroxymethylbilane synthase